MIRRWKAGMWTAVIVALVAAISVSADQHEARTPFMTIEEGAR